ncbi:hypothetical protein HUA74_30575 [Myxococcus sp. CA051A]|uniref:hypothetical protein n=1 Tax=Myxococcus sp. CA051A TaxID=2741739 RepID=UPI00157B45B3|nr:hypothetical protein [Myxococcus sp. CA051A]NTX65009.1 hypothetical protein [Myxococcus sp. CA051A]
MGRRWAWVGMLGLCAWVSGCAERQGQDPATSARSASGQSEQAVPPPSMAGGVAGQTGATQDSAEAPGNAARNTGTVPGTGNAATGNTGNAAARNTSNATRSTGNTSASNATGTGNAARNTGSTSTGNAPGTGNAARSTGNTSASSATGTGNTAVGNTTGTGTTTGATAQAPGAGRVMIGTEAVQASDDEDWFKGAARAAQAALPENTSNRALEDVVIASSAVSGRVTRVSRDTITVRDSDGSDYVLTLDERSQGVRQGRRVSLRQLQAGTPVRARFVLMGGRSVARDVRIRR